MPEGLALFRGTGENKTAEKTSGPGRENTLLLANRIATGCKSPLKQLPSVDRLATGVLQPVKHHVQHPRILITTVQIPLDHVCIGFGKAG